MRSRATYRTALISLCLLFSSISAYGHVKKDQTVLFILSAHEHGYWLPEVLTPYKILSDAGYNVQFASPGGAPGVQAGGGTMNDLERLTLASISATLAKPLNLATIDPSSYVALYVPGGAGPMFDLFDHPHVNRITASMYESGKPVSADCHGPAAFAGVRLSNGQLMVEGKRLTAKSNAEENDWARENYPFLLQDKLQQASANFSAASPYEAWVVQDGNLLTGQNPASAEPLAKALLELIKSTDRIRSRNSID
ncbi:MAG: type 1 glutamine amidotransferase domain-containing protein [Gammaproteobacteria bacterium]